MKNILLILSAILMLSCSSDDDFNFVGTTWLSEDGQSTITFLNDKDVNINNEYGNQTHGYEADYGKINNHDAYIFMTLNYLTAQENGEACLMGFNFNDDDNDKIRVEESYFQSKNGPAAYYTMKSRVYFRQ